MIFEPPPIATRRPRVLIACEHTGTVRDAFTRMGCDAWSCDLLPTESPGQHYQCDVRNVLSLQWDMLGAHPTCRYLANSGVHHLQHDTARGFEIQGAADFFNLFWKSPIPHIYVENPIPHGYAKELVGDYTQIIQPWQFGHTEQKATCLWLKNLPPLSPTQIMKSEMAELTKQETQRLHYLPPSEDRWKIRSATFSGIADAMATQWAPLL